MIVVFDYAMRDGDKVWRRFVYLDNPVDVRTAVEMIHDQGGGGVRFGLTLEAAAMRENFYYSDDDEEPKRTPGDA